VNQPDPALLKFVRRTLRRNPALTPDELVEQWHAQAERAGRTATDAEDAWIRQMNAEEASAAAEHREEQSAGGILLGCASVLALNVIVVVLLSVLDRGVGGLALLGLVQLLYLVPIGFVLWRRGNTPALQGLIIAAAVTFSFSAACFGLASMFGVNVFSG
jgi:hypothetical protein